MFDKTRGFFATALDHKSDMSTEADDLRMAVVSVLISAARTDSLFAQTEYNTIVNIATNKLGLGQEKVTQLLSSEQDEEIISETIKELRASLNPAQREQLLAFTYSIISADRIVEDDESAFALKLQTELGLTIEQAVRARKQSEGVVIDGFKEFVEASPEVIAQTGKWAKGE